MIEIKNEYKDKNGIIYNVRNINVDEPKELTEILGKLVNFSSPENEDDFEIYEDGVNIFLSKFDPTKAFRLYKDHNIYEYTNHSDHIIVSELQKRQKNIKLSEFPTGIVTIKDKVMGQEIPFYENSETIYKYFKEHNMKKRPTEFYLEVLKILKELCNEGIVYTDIHTRNFLINNITEVANIIDFEDSFIYLDGRTEFAYSTMINNLKFYLLNILNKIKGIEFNNSYDKAETLEQIEEVVRETDYKLKVK